MEDQASPSLAVSILQKKRLHLPLHLFGLRSKWRLSSHGVQRGLDVDCSGAVQLGPEGLDRCPPGLCLQQGNAGLVPLWNVVEVSVQLFCLPGAIVTWVDDRATSAVCRCTFAFWGGGDFRVQHKRLWTEPTAQQRDCRALKQRAYMPGDYSSVEHVIRVKIGSCGGRGREEVV